MNSTTLDFTSTNQPVVIITGPTASGKTAAALEICRRMWGEIVSADSMQIYRGMDIGTAKASVTEQTEIRHHLIDIRKPGDYFSVAQYSQLAEATLRDIRSRGRLAVVCGGTGQYISALLDGLVFAETPSDSQLKERLKQRAAEEGLAALHAELVRIDPAAAVAIAATDQRRTLRALELYYLTGLTKTEHNRRSRRGPQFPFISFCLTHDRELLYQRINQRVEAMIDAGLTSEVQNLLAQGIDAESTCMQAIGYKEIRTFLQDHATLEEAVAQIQMVTRRYAKRQLTWFKRIPSLIWLNNLSCVDAVEQVLAAIQTRPQSS